MWCGCKQACCWLLPPSLQGWRLHALVVLCYATPHVLVAASYAACLGVPEGNIHEGYTRSSVWQCPDQTAARMFARVGAMPVHSRMAPAGLAIACMAGHAPALVDSLKHGQCPQVC